MFSHVMVGTRDLEKAKAFYNKVLGTLGFEGEPIHNVGPSGHSRLFYRHPLRQRKRPQQRDREAML